MRLACLLVAIGALVLALIPLSIDAAPPHAAPETYVVQAGDTLFSIAMRYNTTVAAIKQLNKLTSDTILVGQKLLIPAEATPPTVKSISYIVQPGDSLSSIASRYGISVRELMQLNDIPNPNLIRAGDALAIPASASVSKPGLILEPPYVRQGGTLVIKVARPALVSVSGTLNGKPLTFTRATGYWYALVGISRCAKLGNARLTLTMLDTHGQSTSDSANVNIVATAFPITAIHLPPAKLAILQDTALINREAAELAAIVNHYTPTRLWSGAFRQPVYGTLSEYFGARRSYNGGPVGACGHEGTDFAMPGGTPIYAPARGRVVFAGPTHVRGNLTVIDHGLGVFSAYYHQAAIEVTVGQMVQPGMLIGKVGTTGLSTGNHLHWSMWVNGEYVDPLEWTRRVIP